MKKIMAVRLFFSIELLAANVWFAVGIMKHLNVALPLLVLALSWAIYLLLSHFMFKELRKHENSMEISGIKMDSELMDNTDNDDNKDNEIE